jgi:ligand-binding sensor domain-containing protein
MRAEQDKIWLGSDGGGLFEFDKAKREFSSRTEADGLAKNWIASLCLIGDSLWIGYGGTSGGALGRLNLQDGKMTSFMNSRSREIGIGVASKHSILLKNPVF